MVKKFDNPVSHKVSLLKLFAKREEYLKDLKDKIDDEIQAEKEYNYELEHKFNLIEGALSELSFLSNVILLLGEDSNNE